MFDPYMNIDPSMNNGHLYSQYDFSHNYSSWHYATSQVTSTDAYSQYCHEQLAKPMFEPYTDAKTAHMPMLDAPRLAVYPSPTPSLSGSPMLQGTSDVSYTTSIAPSNLIWTPASDQSSPTLASVCSPKSEQSQAHLVEPENSYGYFTTFSVASVTRTAGNDRNVEKSTKSKKRQAKPRRPATVTMKANHKPVRDGQTYQCDYLGCTKTFTRPYNLKSHKRTHTAEKPFACEYPGCERTFARQHDRNRHSKLHLGLKPYTCEHCSKSFARQDALNRHQRVIGAPCSILALEKRKEDRLRQ
ncbi:hypothetical protein NQZ79_g949 [Umbelopsis isabellina]|nr:hypothetical protein NQZ79_g949 [Umbelopsis isabellina]